MYKVQSPEIIQTSSQILGFALAFNSNWTISMFSELEA